MHGLRKRKNSFVIASHVTDKEQKKVNQKVGSRLVSVQDFVTSVAKPLVLQCQ